MSSLGCANPGIGNNFSHDDFIKALNNGSIKLYCAITIANNSNTPPSSATELKLKYRGYSITDSSGEPSYIYETDITEIDCEIYSNQQYYLWIYCKVTQDNYALFYVPSLNYLEYDCILSGEISVIEESSQPYQYYKPKLFFREKYAPCKAYIYNGSEYIEQKQAIAIAPFEVKLFSSATGTSKLVLYDDDNFDLTLWIKKNFGANQKMRVHVTLKNSGNNTSAHKYGDIVILTNEYVPIKLIEQFSEYQQLLQKYGFFTINVNIQDLSTKEIIYSTTYPFCRIRQSVSPMPLFGMNTTLPANTNNATTFINLIADTGASVYRVTLPWESIEREQNILTIPTLAMETINYARSKGIKVLIILAYGNKLYGESNPNDSTWLAAYARYCETVATQLKGKVDYYEVWNEWNHPTMSKIPLEYQDGKHYAKVLDAAYNAIQNVAPEAEIIGGVVAGAPETWIEDVIYNSQIFNNLKNFSFHLYPLINNEFVKPLNYDFDRYFNSIHKLIGNKSIWLTEFGWSTHEGTSSKYKGVSEQEAAAYIVQFYMWALANQNNYNIKNICLYTLMNTGNTITYPQHNFGLVYHYNASIPYAPKAGFSASNAMSYFVSQMKTMPTKSTNSTENLTIYQCNSNNNKVMQVIWANNEQEQTYTITNAQVMDIYGAVTNYPNQTVLTVTETPIYILYN